MQVDFMIIGAQKCGTTALAEQLAAHPQICFCRVKEPGYFSTTHDWQAKLPPYHRMFTPPPVYIKMMFASWSRSWGGGWIAAPVVNPEHAV